MPYQIKLFLIYVFFFDSPTELIIELIKFLIDWIWSINRELDWFLLLYQDKSGEIAIVSGSSWLYCVDIFGMGPWNI